MNQKMGADGKMFGSGGSGNNFEFGERFVANNQHLGKLMRDGSANSSADKNLNGMEEIMDLSNIQ